jgi:hypothetical protein
MIGRLISFVLILLPVVTSAQMITDGNREEDMEHKRAREEWIRQMHRADPAINTSVIDDEQRMRKAAGRYEEKLRRTIRPQSVELDTIADGTVIGKWTERGSNNVAGRMHTCDVDWDTRMVYAASSYGNIWKGSIDGTGWTCLNDDQRFRDVRMLRIFPYDNKKRILAVANGPSAAFYSDDDGYTWKSSSGLDAPRSWGWFRRAIATEYGDTVYAAGTEWDYSANWRSISMMYRSTDGGKSFRSIYKGNNTADRFDVWVSRTSSTPAYCILGDSIGTIGDTIVMKYKLPVGDLNGSYHTLRGAVVGGKVRLVLFVMRDGRITPYTTNDEGQTWTMGSVTEGGAFDNNNSVAVSSNFDGVLYYGGVNTYIGRNNGSQWSKVSDWSEYYAYIETRLHADIPGFDILHDFDGTEYVFISTDGGLYYSTDSLHTVKNITLRSIGTSQYYGLLTSTAEKPYHIYAGSQDQGFQKGIDTLSGTLGFRQTISGDYGHLVSADSGRSVWCNYPGFTMYYPDARASDVQRGWSFPTGNRLWLPPVTVHPKDPRIAFVAAGIGDSSVLWKLRFTQGSVSPSLLPYDFSNGDKNNRLTAFAISPIDTNYWYALTNDGRFLRSTNAGAVWMQPDTFVAPGGHYFYGSVIVPSETVLGEIVIGGSGYSNTGVYHSTDHGTTFRALDISIPATLFYDIASTPDGAFLFAATEIGPYLYSREMDRWFDMSGLHAPDHVYWTVEYIPEIKTARFGTYGRGIWDFSIETFYASVKTDGRRPSEKLQMNAFTAENGKTGLAFTIPTRQAVTLRIYDLTGRMISEVYSGELLQGGHTMFWDERQYPAGIYFAVLSGTDGVTYAKIPLAK